MESIAAVEISCERPLTDRTDAQAYIRTHAFELAEKGRGLTSPGAMVGAVIVKDGQIVGEGFYTYDGVRHAEIIALEQAGDSARGATVYTNLEPCSHHGRTAPCAEALIEAGVARVVTAMAGSQSTREWGRNRDAARGRHPG